MFSDKIKFHNGIQKVETFTTFFHKISTDLRQVFPDIEFPTFAGRTPAIPLISPRLRG